MNQTVIPEMLKQLPADFFEREQDNLSAAETALRQGYRELSGHVAKLSSELEAARLARRKENRERENLLNRFATMLDALPGGVIILDKAGTITEANPQARACWAATRGTTVGCNRTARSLQFAGSLRFEVVA